MKRNKMKKKGIALLLALTMAAAAMTGCGDKKDPEPVKELDFADIAGDTTNDADNAPESPDVEESFTEQVEEETREGMYRSEITNEWIDESLKNQRPIAVMVDNEKTALPHYGLTEADVVYELMNSTELRVLWQLSRTGERLSSLAVSAVPEIQISCSQQSGMQCCAMTEVRSILTSGLQRIIPRISAADFPA